MMKARYDRGADAAYFEFSSAASARQVPLDDGRVLDYGEDGRLVGVEILSPSRGVRLEGLPRVDEIARGVRRLGFRIADGAATADASGATHRRPGG